MIERIENLQSQQASLQSENERLESEVQKLQQKLKVMTELYQENEMKLHRCWFLFLYSMPSVSFEYNSLIWGAENY